MTAKGWKKNLYENEGYADNFTDTSFLEEMKKNVYVRDITFKSAVLGAGLVAQQASIVVVFTLIFVYLYNDWVEAETIFTESLLISAFGYLLHRILFVSQVEVTRKVLANDLRIALIFLVFGYFLSPILKTLTDTISTDTIYATTTFMMCIHLVFFDYGVSTALVSSSLSLNAAIFGSVCLASRLKSPFHAFVLLTVAVECFAVLPSLLARFSDSITVLVIIVLTATYTLWTVSLTLSILFASVIIFITILCSVWFLRWQQYKDNIYGPWDEAIVDDAEN